MSKRRAGGSLKDEAREKVRARLNKVAGQVAGIQRMVEEDRYCVDVLHQIAAVEGALDRVGHLVLASHVETCVTSAIESGDPRERAEKLDELMGIFSRFGRVRP
jgi:DNA-binding FrmR family transcriptional regulator